MISSEAATLAERGEKVMILLFVDGQHSKNPDSLISLQLRENFKNQDNIKVQSVVLINGQTCGLKEITEGFANVLVDEFFGDFDHLHQINQDEFKEFVSSKERVWIAFSNWYFGNKLTYNSRIDPNTDLVDLVQSWFPDFKIIHDMKKPLRSTAKIVQHIKNEWGQGNDYNQILMHLAEVPPNLVDGFEPDRIDTDSLVDFLSTAIGKCPKNRKLAIVLYDGLNFQSYAKEYLSSNEGCECKNRLMAYAVDLALEAINCPRPLYHTIFYQSPQSEVVEWIKGKTKDQILVVSYELIKGFEADVVVDLLDATEVLSRCSTTYVSWLRENTSDLVQHIFNKLKDIDHDCSKLMERNQRPIVDLRPLDKIGSFYLP